MNCWIGSQTDKQQKTRSTESAAVAANFPANFCCHQLAQSTGSAAAMLRMSRARTTECATKANKHHVLPSQCFECFECFECFGLIWWIFDGFCNPFGTAEGPTAVSAARIFWTRRPADPLWTLSAISELGSCTLSGAKFVRKSEPWLWTKARLKNSGLHEKFRPSLAFSREDLQLKMGVGNSQGAASRTPLTYP